MVSFHIVQLDIVYFGQRNRDKQKGREEAKENKCINENSSPSVCVPNMYRKKMLYRTSSIQPINSLNSIFIQNEEQKNIRSHSLRKLKKATTTTIITNLCINLCEMI